MKTEIKHKWFYQQSPEEIWDYLTKPELLSSWLMENNIAPEEGHEFWFKTRPMPDFGFDGNVYCRILEATPFSKLSYTWKGGPGNGQINLDTIVYWTLKPKDGGTELSLLHTGFTHENEIIYAAMDHGWLKNIKEIEEILNGTSNGTTCV